MGPLGGVVLAGGAARRLSGIDKPLLVVDGETLLQRAVSAVAEHADGPIVVVGPRRPGPAGVRWTREEPPGSGPLAALAAGLRQVDTPLVAVLAADLRAVRAGTVGRLRAALEDATGRPGVADAAGAVLVDDGGHRQWLIGVWRAAALRDALPPEPGGKSLRATLGALSTVEVPALPGEAADVDTPEDLAP